MPNIPDLIGNINETWLSKAQKLAISDKSLGSVVIPAGDTSITVSTNGLTDESKIFVSTEKPISVGVANKNPQSPRFAMVEILEDGEFNVLETEIK